MTEQLHWLNAHELAARFRDGSLSPVEVLRHLLDRIDRLEPQFNVFVTLDRNGAMAQAKQAEAEIARGEMRGPLHGVPVGIKDVIDVEGLPTTCHSARGTNHVAARDAGVVERLRRAGAVILGKVATWEFAFGGPCYDLPYPPAGNPWKKGRQPGGSSSGCGAGLAAGFFPLAIGTDTGGSIRNPAASCGVIGLKPSHDAVPRSGVFPLSSTMDHVGPMARSVRDIELLMEAIADDREPAVPGKGVEGVRIGYVRHFHRADSPADPEVAEALDRAADTLSGLGAEVTEVSLPPLGLFMAAGETILYSEAWAVHADALRSEPETYAQLTRRMLLTGAFLSAGDYVDAQRWRTALTSAVTALLQDVDVLLLANSLDPAGPLDAELRTTPAPLRQVRMPFNLTGNPAIGLMSGLSEDGMPLSLQLVGRHGADRQLLQVAAAYEQATGYHAMRAPLACAEPSMLSV